MWAGRLSIVKNDLTHVKLHAAEFFTDEPCVVQKRLTDQSQRRLRSFKAAKERCRCDFLQALSRPLEDDARWRRLLDCYEALFPAASGVFRSTQFRGASVGTLLLPLTHQVILHMCIVLWSSSLFPHLVIKLSCSGQPAKAHLSRFLNDHCREMPSPRMS